MNRKILLLGFLASAFIFSAAAALVCRSCGSSPALALAGMGVYGAMLAVGAFTRQDEVLRVGLYLAGGFHVGLLWIMLDRESACIPCIGSAASCFGAILTRPYAGAEIALLPGTAAIAISMIGTVPDARTEQLRMVVYTSDQCPYCEIFRTEVLPEAIQGIEVEVEFKSADSASWVTQTPTILITGPKSKQVVEGVPRPETLKKLLIQVRGDR